jgi:competence protein ComEC
MRRPLLGLAAAFATGCLLADGEAGPSEAFALIALAGVLLCLALAAGAGRGAGAALVGVALALGAAAADVEVLEIDSGGLHRLASDAERQGRPLRLVGTVRGDAVESAGRLSFALDVAGVEVNGRLVPTAGRIRIDLGGRAQAPSLADGDGVAAWVSVRALRSGDAARAGFSALGYCKTARLVDQRDATEAGPLRRAAARLREGARVVFARSMPPGTERGLVRAMVLGDRSEVDEGTAEAFRASGTYHVLALSGAQVALVAGLIVAALRRLRADPWALAVTTALAIGFYSLLVGGDVPVVRAALMASAVLAGKALELDADASNLLGLAALALLVHRPAAAADVGFQLSFGATLGILAFAGPLTRGLPRLPFRLDLAVAASVAAQCALAPILAFWFHRLAPAAVLLNIAAVPLSGAVLLSGLAVLAAAPLGAAAGQLAGDVAWVAARALRWSGDLGPLGPWLDLRVAGPSLAAIGLYVAGLTLLHRERRGAGLGLLAACHLALLAGPLSREADGRLHLVVIDVGQGDGLLLLSPSGRSLLVDAGGSRDGRFDPGERRVAPELWRRGVHRVDALVVTHAHPDHVGGARFLLHAFRVAEIWEGPAPGRDLGWRSGRSGLDEARATRVTVAEGVEREWDGVRVAVRGPRRPVRPALAVRNEDSVVLDIGFGEVHLLLPGDVAGAAADGLRVAPAFVVKVPHHGSRASSSPAFLSRVAPRLAVISVGARNPFGHPHPEVVERYRRAGSLLFRTDRDGTVEVTTDGRRVWVRAAGEGEERRIR